MNKLTCLFFILLSIVGQLACGQKGPLVLPEEHQQETQTSPSGEPNGPRQAASSR